MVTENPAHNILNIPLNVVVCRNIVILTEPVPTWITTAGGHKGKLIMQNLDSTQDNRAENPLDIVEQMVEVNEWMFDRRSDQEMAVQVPGTWCDYSLYFAWNEEMEALHFTCAFDMRVADDQKPRVYELLAKVNDRLWLGHFSIWESEGLPMFRHALPLRSARGPAIEQMEDLVETAIIECERFYPAFQYVIWGGKDADEAISSAMIDTVGEA